MPSKRKIVEGVKENYNVYRDLLGSPATGSNSSVTKGRVHLVEFKYTKHNFIFIHTHQKCLQIYINANQIEGS